MRYRTLIADPGHRWALGEVGVAIEEPYKLPEGDMILAFEGLVYIDLPFYSGLMQRIYSFRASEVEMVLPHAPDLEPGGKIWGPSLVVAPCGTSNSTASVGWQVASFNVRRVRPKAS